MEPYHNLLRSLYGRLIIGKYVNDIYGHFGQLVHVC